VVKSFGKFSPLCDPKKPKKGSANLAKELIFSKKAQSCYILRANFFYKSGDNKFQIYWGKSFSPLQLTPKKEK
jgi:hypothetical protein